MKSLSPALLALVLVPGAASQQASSSTSTEQAAAQQVGSEKSQQTLSENADPADVLRGFKTYYIKSDTIYLHRETLQKEFQNRKEFAAWGVTETQDAKSADVLITITLPFMTWEWNYRMMYQATGKVLGTGKISAAVEKTAAPQLAAMMVERIREVRPLPGSFQETETTLQAQPNPKAETGKSWQVTYVSGSVAKLAQNSSVKLTVNHDWVAVRSSKTAFFSLPTSKIANIASSNEVRKATSGWDQFWETSFNKLGCADESCGALLLLPAVPVILAGHGVLAPMKATDHFVTIYWMEDGAVKSAEFRASVDDAKSMVAELKQTTGKSAVDIQESIKKREAYIKNAYYNSPIVDIKRKVNLGWSKLAPKEYRLIINPALSGFAEVYFYPAQTDSWDIDLVKESVAEYEVRRTRLETPGFKVSYREQNGMILLDKIEGPEFILRFTPVPLASPN